jgi:hypothetical protein
MALADTLKDAWCSLSERVADVLPWRKAPAPQRANPRPRSDTFKQNDLFRGVPALSQFNACVGNNGGPYDLYDYAEGYFEATRLLLQEAQKPGVLMDIIVYPVCLNFRHALELYIKYLITDLGKAARINATYRPNHSLRDNWKAAKKLMKRAKFRSTQEQMAVIDSAVKDIKSMWLPFLRLPYVHTSERHA